MSKEKSNTQNAKEPSVAKIAIWYTFSNLVVSGLGFLTTPIFTRLLSKSELGQYSNFVTWESILTVILSLNLLSSIARAKYDFSEEMDSYVFSILFLSNLVTLLGYTFAEIFPSFFTDLFSMDMNYIRILFVECIFWTSFMYFTQQQRVFQKYKLCVALSIISALIRVGTELLLVRMMDDKAWGRTLGYVLPFAVMNIGIWAWIAIRGKRIHLRHMKYACIFSVPMILHVMAGRALSSADKIMIRHICSSEAVALYSLPYTISSIASVVWMAMNQAWLPWLYDRLAIDETDQIHEKVRWYLGFFSLFVVGIFLIAPEILLIMGGKGYLEALGAMPPVILGCAYQFIYSLYASIEMYTKHTTQVSVATGIAAVFNIIANAVFIPRYGYQAAAYTTAAGYLLLLLLHYYMVKRRGLYTDIYDNRFVFLTAVFLTAIMFVCMFLYEHSVVRWSIFSVYAIIIIGIGFRNRERLIRMFI